VAVILDSDAVVGFLDRGDALHPPADAAIRELAREHRLVASVITYAEVLTGARLGHHRVDHVVGFFTGLISELWPVDADVAARAADLRAATRWLRMPDALILATADIRPDVDLILTADVRTSKISHLDCDVRLLEPETARR
jgi:predicted nucleic acid-binding protein